MQEPNSPQNQPADQAHHAVSSAPVPPEFAKARKARSKISKDLFTRSAEQSRSSGNGAFPLQSAFKCAWDGIVYTFVSQRNLKIQLVLGLAAVVLGLLFQISVPEWLAIVLCIMVVSAGELINTAIESVVDIASPDYHHLAKAAKDAAAGAVFLCALGSVAVAALIFAPRIIALITG